MRHGLNTQTWKKNCNLRSSNKEQTVNCKSNLAETGTGYQASDTFTNHDILGTYSFSEIYEQFIWSEKPKKHI